MKLYLKDSIGSLDVNIDGLKNLVDEVIDSEDWEDLEHLYDRCDADEIAEYIEDDVRERIYEDLSAFVHDSNNGIYIKPYDLNDSQYIQLDEFIYDRIGKYIECKSLNKARKLIGMDTDFEVVQRINVFEGFQVL